MTVSKTTVSSYVQSGSHHPSLNTSTNQTNIRWVIESFELRNGQEVESYLIPYSELIKFLHEARDHLAKLFGTDTSYALEIFTDPETTSEQRLDVCIQTPDDVDEAMGKLDNFDEWFIWQDVFSKDIVNFSLELV